VTWIVAAVVVLGLVAGYLLAARVRRQRTMALLVTGMRELGSVMAGQDTEFLGSVGPMLQFRIGADRIAIDANAVVAIIASADRSQWRNRLTWLVHKARPGAELDQIQRVPESESPRGA